ncbi:MAG: glutamine--fructose-6-phosphate transaminase (isomerizing) [Candidatus Cloacimonetes bacterium]|nr:glutamine--fructose-6-phosphate transaminase (isomerizing) [Candidatus Cloacimonadota bacterium]
MCGIVGYIGHRNAIPIVIEGIKRLEYRGYDSSGVAVIGSENTLGLFRRQGKVIELERSLPAPSKSAGNVAIAHTRWATHGEPSERNAHPHTNCEKTLAVAHNGIIENFKALRDRLEAEGCVFASETDTEVLPHLIGFFRQKGLDLTEAVRETLQLVDGTYGIAVVDTEQPDRIVAARKGSPLILGIGDDEFFVTSDVSAIIIHTKKVIYLEDREIVTVRRDGFEISTLDNISVEGKVSIVEWDVSSIDKGPYKHFMLKEIFEQPESVANAFRGRIADSLSTARLGGLGLPPQELRRIKQIQIIACGTSWHAGLIGSYIIEDIARVPVRVEYAGEYRYRNPIIPEDTLVLVISQSGETADTLAALREARARGVRVLGLTNVVGSTIARETDGGVYIHAGAEIGVASTKAFTSQVTVLTLLAVLLGRMRHLSPLEGAEILNELKHIPDKIQTILDMNVEIRAIAASMVDDRNALYLGRGVHYPVALEGALKLKEISYIHAEGYPAAEMKHGPIALIDKEMPVVAIAMRDALYDKIVSNLQEVKARHGRLITIVDGLDDQIEALSDHTLCIPATLPTLQPLLSVIPLQLLAYHVADLRNMNVDQPRNLAKSVTVE